MIFHDSGLILALNYNYPSITMVLIYKYVFQQWYEYFGFDKPPWFGTLSRQYIFGLRHCNYVLINCWD